MTPGHRGGRFGHFGVLRLDGRPKIEGRADQRGARAVRSKRFGLVGEDGRLVPAVLAKRDLGQRQPALGRIRMVVDQTLIGAERRILGPAGHLELGKLRQRLAMGRHVFQHVAELQHRRAEIALGHERLGVLQMPRGAVLGVFAGREGQQKGGKTEGAK